MYIQLRWLASTGCYGVQEPLAETEFDDAVAEQTMLQEWPVRQARPVAARLQLQKPLLTGQRVLDSLFPCGQGASVALPGPFGCGKTDIAHALAKHSNCDVVVYVGCGERGNEMAQLLADFARLDFSHDGVRY